MVRRSALTAVIAGAVMALSGCGGSASPAQTVTVSASPTSESPAAVESPSPEASSPEAEETESATPAAAETFVMPKVVGMVLQTAQDLLQSKGSYLMDQQDAAGLGRLQLLDANWKVCSQKPKAGVKVSTDTVVVLASVKLEEKCP